MKQLRKLLFPFSALYYVVIWLRNALYDRGVFKSHSYEFPVLCVGNLSTGGTGKTPMTEFLIRLLQKQTQVGVLSRGYGRKTKGFIKVSSSHTALEVGDEPLQYATKFEGIAVAVCEDRREGIRQLREQKTPPQTIILDDAFQHRKVTAGYSIVLTSFTELFYEDYVLPAGNLRDLRHQAKRAQAIIVTKCPKNLSLPEQATIRKKISSYSASPVYFAGISYDDGVQNTAHKQVSLDGLKQKSVTLVTGIANPQPLVTYLNDYGLKYEHIKYGDHHNFTVSDLQQLEQCSCILTTEKDYMRLQNKLKNPELFYLPMKMEFLGDGRQDFEQRVSTFVHS